MKISKFKEEELQVTGEFPAYFGGPGTPVYNYPISEKESIERFYHRKPVWQISSVFDASLPIFTPAVISDNTARAFVFDGTFVPGVSNQSGGKDMFGIEWEFVPSAGGSMVHPGKPFAEDADDMLEKIVWPDPDKWDWENARRINEGYLRQNKYVNTWFFTGYFERLISMLDFENAVVALIDEEQKDAVHSIFSKLTDLYIKIFEKMLEAFQEIKVIYFHDDWGSQRASFFSPDTGEEMLVPYMKRLTDYLHSKNVFCHLHSCGHLMNQIENIIAAGWDAWDPQVMNNIPVLYDKYGDKILIGTIPETIFDPAASTEEEQRESAKAYANRFCRKDKPSFLSMYAGMLGQTTPAFLEELYKCSRINYQES